MKIYVVCEDVEYESLTIVGFYLSKEGATAARDRFEAAARLQPYYEDHQYFVSVREVLP